jgi:hypothetical protein
LLIDLLEQRPILAQGFLCGLDIRSQLMRRPWVPRLGGASCCASPKTADPPIHLGRRHLRASLLGPRVSARDGLSVSKEASTSSDGALRPTPHPARRRPVELPALAVVQRSTRKAKGYSRWVDDRKSRTE